MISTFYQLEQRRDGRLAEADDLAFQVSETRFVLARSLKHVIEPSRIPTFRNGLTSVGGECHRPESDPCIREVYSLHIVISRSSFTGTF